MCQNCIRTIEAGLKASACEYQESSALSHAASQRLLMLGLPDAAVAAQNMAAAQHVLANALIGISAHTPAIFQMQEAYSAMPSTARH